MHPLGVVPGGDAQRRVGSLAQCEQLCVKSLDLCCERPVAARQRPQCPFGRAGGGIAGSVKAPPGTDLDHLRRLESSQPVSEVLRGGHRDSVDLVGGDGAGLDRGAPRQRQRPDRLDATVRGLGHSSGVAAERGAGCGLGVDGVGLAAAASRLAVRAVHLHHLDAGRGEVPGQARTVGSGALDSDTAHSAPRLQPAGELVIAAGIGRELRRAQQPPGRVDRGGDMNVFVGVDPAEDSGSVHSSPTTGPLVCEILVQRREGDSNPRDP